MPLKVQHCVCGRSAETVLFCCLTRLFLSTSAPEVIKPTTTTAPVVCPADWHLFNNSCYFISRNTRDWPESQSYCQSKGGHLAIILTAEEQVRPAARAAAPTFKLQVASLLFSDRNNLPAPVRISVMCDLSFRHDAAVWCESVTWKCFNEAITAVLLDQIAGREFVFSGDWVSI